MIDGTNELPRSGRSAVWVEPNVIGVREVAVAPPGPNEVLVRIRACGICGSDLHGFHSDRARRHLPGIGPGHELAGEVVALGPAVDGPAPGTRVALLAARVCGVCAQCRSGNEQRCPQLKIAGGGYPGGMGDYFTAQAGFLYPLPDGMPWEVAALSEPCGISLHGLKRAGIARGQRVLVIGAGTIGLFAVLVAHDAGAARIGVSARYPQQADAARSLGATDVFDPNDVRAGTDVAAAGWDLVVETVGGATQTLQQALEVTERGGTVALLGVHTVPQAIGTLGMIMRELTIVGSFGYDHAGPRSDYEEALALLAKYQQRVRPLVTHTFPLDRAGEAFATALYKRSDAIKVTVLP